MTYIRTTDRDKRRLVRRLKLGDKLEVGKAVIEWRWRRGNVEVIITDCCKTVKHVRGEG